MSLFLGLLAGGLLGAYWTRPGGWLGGVHGHAPYQQYPSTYGNTYYPSTYGNTYYPSTYGNTYYPYGYARTYPYREVPYYLPYNYGPYYSTSYPRTYYLPW